MEHLGEWQFLLGVIVGVAAVAFLIGNISQKATSAHKRIDKLEAMLEAQLEKFGDRLENAIRNGWRHCPLIHGHPKEDNPP